MAGWIDRCILVLCVFSCAWGERNVNCTPYRTYRLSSMLYCVLASKALQDSWVKHQGNPGPQVISITAMQATTRLEQDSFSTAVTRAAESDVWDVVPWLCASIQKGLRARATHEDAKRVPDQCICCLLV